MDLNKLNEQCKNIKHKILELTASTGKNGAHAGGALSATELVASIINRIDYNESDRDSLILSKGHGALALYGALWQNGLMSDEELAGFDKNGSGLYGHPHRNLKKGLDFSAGSLGLGVSYAVGLSLGKSKKGATGKVYTIIGDGECDEGIVWEALMSAANFKLTNFIPIIDRNGWQLDGKTSEIMNNADLAEKLKAFGYETIVINGHDLNEIAAALDKAESNSTPLAIVADTVKGHGVSFLENSRDSHFSAISEKKYQMAVDEINSSYK